MKKFVIAAACAVLSMVAGCDKKPAGEPEKPARTRIGLVAKSLGNGFFDAVHKGAREAAKELDAEVIFTGPTTPTGWMRCSSAWARFRAGSCSWTGAGSGARSPRRGSPTG